MKIATRCVCCDGAQLRRSPAVLMPFLAHRIFGWETTDITPEWNMRDLAPGRAYSVCNTLACVQCGLLFLDMRFDDEEMEALYADYRGEAYCAARERFEPGYSRRNAILNEGNDTKYVRAIEDFLAPHLGPRPRILDWGGDTGLNTPFRGRANLHHVLDISNKPVVAGAEKVESAPACAYDLIVSSQVLEHVPDPMTLLVAMSGSLGPGSLLYLEVPHEDLIRLEPDPAERPRCKRHWHEHINFFTEPALDAMLRRAGLAAIARISHPVSAGGRQSHIYSVLAQRTDAGALDPIR